MKKTRWVIFTIGLLGVMYFWKNVDNRESSDFVRSYESNESFKNKKDSSNEKINIENEKSVFEPYLKSLPNLADLSKLSYEEAHHTPEIIREGGELVGKINQQAQDDPTKRVAAMDFFKSCVEDEFVAPAIRALCLHKIYKLIPVWQIPVPLSEENIPQDIIDLSMKLH